MKVLGLFAFHAKTFSIPDNKLCTCKRFLTSATYKTFTMPILAIVIDKFRITFYGIITCSTQFGVVRQKTILAKRFVSFFVKLRPYEAIQLYIWKYFYPKQFPCFLLYNKGIRLQCIYYYINWQLTHLLLI